MMSSTGEETINSPCKGSKTLESIVKTTEWLDTLQSETTAAAKKSINIEESGKKQHLKEKKDGNNLSKSVVRKVLFDISSEHEGASYKGTSKTLESIVKTSEWLNSFPQEFSSTAPENYNEDYGQKQQFAGSGLDLKEISNGEKSKKRGKKMTLMSFKKACSHKEKIRPTGEMEFCTLFNMRSSSVSPSEQATLKKSIEKCEKKQVFQKPLLHVKNEFSYDESKLTKPENEKLSFNIKQGQMTSDETMVVDEGKELTKEAFLKLFHLKKKTDHN